MDSVDSAATQERACEAIEKAAFDFTAKFYAAYDLFSLARKGAETITPRAVDALKGLLLSHIYDGQRQRLFLFREAANVLAIIVHLGRRRPIARLAYHALVEVLIKAGGPAHLAAAEALGSLPLDIRGPHLAPLKIASAPTLDWGSFLKIHHLPVDLAFSIQGRSLVAREPGQTLVVKLARQAEDGPALQREVQWLHYLSAIPGCPAFDIPRPLEINGAALFRLSCGPVGGPPLPVQDANPLAIAFIAPDGYFHYPNCGEQGQLPDAGAFLEIMARNAFLLSHLAGQGVVHEAAIPLFHNRVQQERRRDGGLYEWYRAGRLDRWLASCAYPNFGRSGLRDFEHFAAFQGKSLALFRQMGNHLLSLLLVTGSYFRAKDPQRVGWDADGKPVDARDLFDKRLLGDLITVIYGNYHLGFVGRSPQGPAPMNIPRLAERMIAEMGVDHYMEEYLRVTDQQQMTSEAFDAFLLQRGYPVQAVRDLKRGQHDLVIHTGPHLGAFNRGISLPELIEAVAAMAGVCVAERFLGRESDGPL